MSIDALFVLPEDIVLAPVVELPPAALERLDHRDGDYVLTRPRSRTASMIVDAQTASLLQLFKRPTTIVDAVIRYSTAAGLDPRETLDTAFPALQDFLNADLLVPVGSELRKPIESSYRSGDFVGAFEVMEPIDVVLDTEIYLARANDGAWVALKLARDGTDRRLATRLAREAAILERLDGAVTPRCLAHADAGGRPFIALSWHRGVDAHMAGAEARRRGDEGRAALFELLERISHAYAHLHRQEVVHGDVHPRNVIVDGSNQVTLIDFGFAISLNEGSDRLDYLDQRGVVDLYMEPELARARRALAPSPQPSTAGEQYSLAALLYFLVTGANTHDFVLEPAEMLRQVCEDPPLAFHEHGVAGFEQVETTLRRALAKNAGERFRDLNEFLSALHEAARVDQSARSAQSGATKLQPLHARRVLDEMLDRVSIGGPLMDAGLKPPTASLHNGAAGIAYALLRIARIRDDDRLLALADLWSNRAVQDVLLLSKDAFHSAELDLTADTIGQRSLYHTGSGVFCVEALIAHARGDGNSQRSAVKAFIAACRATSPHFDVSLGCAGLLLGCSLLLDTTPHSLFDEEASLGGLGDRLCSEVWGDLLLSSPTGHTSTQTTLGAAHGMAGKLYAILVWTEASGRRIPDGLDVRLDELAALATPIGSGLRWPVVSGQRRVSTGLWSSWCNGSAGFVHLWTLAARRFESERYGDLATGAAWAAYQAPNSGSDLCCGLSGRAYALLNLYKYNDEAIWVDRARELAGRAALGLDSDAPLRDSLYKGALGIAVLIADLELPAQSCMPLFEREGWRRQ